MRNTLVLAVFVLLFVGVFFARDRLRRAFQVGVVLYAAVLLIRMLIFGFQDADNILDLLAVGSFFLLIWIAGWAATRAVLRRRERTRRPPS
jgi:hypothetical protein